MAHGSGARNDLIKCEYCGELYSVTYKHCPFCNEDGTGRWDDDEPVADEEEYYEDEEPRGGRRLSGGGGSRGRGPRRPQWEGPSVGTIIGGVLSLVLIIAAIAIVFSIFRSINGDTKPTPTPEPTPTPSESAPVESDPVESDPLETTDPTVPPAPTTPSVDLVKPTDFTLNRTDFTFNKPGDQWQMVARLTPEDATAEVTWKSSNPNVASISWNGLVTAVSPGTVTLTATIEGVGEKKCIVRCTFDATATPAPKPSADNQGSTASGLKLSREDFTLAKKGDTWKLVVSGTTSTVTWTSSKPEVATVAADGTVTNVSKGNSTITAEVDGVKLTCIVRCKDE